MPVKTFDTKKHVLSFWGVPITGFADDDGISIEYNEDCVTLRTGQDGESVRSINYNRSAKIKIKLTDASLSNDVLSAARLADRKGGRGVSPCTLKDLGGTSAALAPTAWVSKEPAFDVGKESGDREWELTTDELFLYVGGRPVG